MAVTPAMEELQAKKDHHIILSAEEITYFNKNMKQLSEMKEILLFLQTEIDTILADVFQWVEIEEYPVGDPKKE